MATGYHFTKHSNALCVIVECSYCSKDIGRGGSGRDRDRVELQSSLGIRLLGYFVING